MIKIKESCQLKHIEYELKMQLDYDPDCKVIAIVPVKLEIGHVTFGAPPTMFNVTHVNIIWDSK